MKKAISLLIAIVTCISFSLSFTSCSSKHPIDVFKEKMENANNYQLAITMSDVPLFGTFTMTTKVDGNIQYTPEVMFSEEEYIETVGDTKYKYTKDDSGKWTKEIDTSDEDDDTDLSNDETMAKLFDPNNFEEVKGEKNTFKQKSSVTFEEFEDVKITIEDSSYIIEMKVTSEGITMGVKMVISKIGEIELTLPEIN